MKTAKLWIVIQVEAGLLIARKLIMSESGRENDIPSIDEIYVHRISNELARIIVTIIAACLPRFRSE